MHTCYWRGLLSYQNLYPIHLYLYIQRICSIQYLQEMGVLGAYGTAIAVVMVSVCITVFTTTEKPGKQISEPIGKS